MASDMQSPTTELPPPAPPRSRPPLRRSSDDRVIGGVAAGIARWLDIDVVLVRVALVVLAVFGGSGLVLYLLAWLFVPSDDEPESVAARAVGNNRTVLWVCAVVVGVLAFGLVSDAWLVRSLQPGVPLVVLLVAALLLYLYLRRDDARDVPHGTEPPPPGPPTEQFAGGGTHAGSPSTVGPAPSPWASTTLPLPTGAPDAAVPPPSTAATSGRRRRPPKPPKPPRERSLLGRITWSVLLLVVGLLLALRFAGVTAVSAVAVLGAALLVVGAGLVVGTWWGRSRGLIWLGVLLVLALVPVGFVDNLGASLRPSNDLTFRPTSMAQLEAGYSTGTGRVALDLTALRPDGQIHDVLMRVTAGVIEVDVPPGLPVQLVGQAELGVVRVPGAGAGDDQLGTSVRRAWGHALTDSGQGVIRIDALVKVGAVDVNLSARDGSPVPATDRPTPTTGAKPSTNRPRDQRPSTQGANA